MAKRSSDEMLPTLLSVATPSIRRNTCSRIGRRSQLPTSISEDQSILQLNKTSISQSRISPAFSVVQSPRMRQLRQGLLSSTAVDISGIANLSESMFDDDMTKNISKSMLIDDDPEIVSNKIFEDFQGFYQCHYSNNEIFSLLESYEQVCSDSVSLMSGIIMSAAPNKQQQCQSLMGLLCMERNTWRLARILYQDRLLQEDMDQNMDFQGTRFHDRQIIDNLYKQDSDVRQCQLVIDWLEKNAADYLEEFKHKYISESKVAWENTLHAIRGRVTNPNQVHVRPMVTEMDPDAPTRQNKQLYDLDRADENQIFSTMFAYIRAGQLEKAQRFAEQCGYFWLSAALDGWRPHCDPNYNSSAGQDLLPTEGNPYRNIWKTHCWKIIEKETLPTYECAIYASVSGNLKGLLPVCHDWEDTLWAYFKSLLDSRIDEELEMYSQQMHQKLQPISWNPVQNQDQIFQEMKASPLEGVRMEFDTPHHMVQRHIILNSVEDVVKDMFGLVSRENNLPHHLTRFFAHFVLFLKTISLLQNEEQCVEILKAYVQVLIKDKRKSLVATYTATLPSSDQIVIYAKFLEGIREHQERQSCLELAKEAGLDVQRITKTVVENIRNRQNVDPHGLSGQLTSETTNRLVFSMLGEHLLLNVKNGRLKELLKTEDLEKIEAIDWLAFDPAQRAEAVKQANALMRVFIGSQKTEAAQQVSSRLPSDSIHIITKLWKKLTGSEDLAPEESNICRELLCFQAYLQALEAFNDWFQYFHHLRPTEPSKPEGKPVIFTDFVAYEHKAKKYEEELERWKRSVEIHTQGAKDRLYNVLLFPDGGWMVDQSPDASVGEEASCREQQMSLLRGLCIPQVSCLLHNVLHNSGQYKEAIQLADILANEKNQLYQEFSKDEMCNFLRKIRDSSLQLLDQNLDPLGYPFQ